MHDEKDAAPHKPQEAIERGFTPTAVSDSAATTEAPESQRAKDEASNEEVENRRTRLSSNLLEQRHSLIEDFGRVILVVVVALYLLFAITLYRLLLGGEAFHKDFKTTGVILVALSGSIPTILSLSFMVGLFAKEKESKDEKPPLDAGSAAKLLVELVKYIKHH